MKKIITVFLSIMAFVNVVHAQTIATGTISTTLCAGASINVPYTITGTYTAGNIFTAQLSSSTGAFTSPVNIGSLASMASGTITAMIPASTTSGTAYRIRVVSNTPVINGTQNASAITISTRASNPSITISSSIPLLNLCANSSVTFTATLSNGGASPVYQWYKNSVAVGSSSTTYTNNQWAKGDTIWCKATGSLSCALNAGASSNYMVVETENSINNTWRQKADLGYTQSNVISPRIEGVAFSIGQKGYVGMGVIGNYYVKDFWEFDPATNTWTQKANSLLTLSNGVGFSIGSKGYVGTGTSSSTNFWEFDPVANIWTSKAAFPGSSRSNAAGFSIGNKGYIGTGDDYFSRFSDFWEYDPSLNTWVQKASFGGGLRSSAVGFSIGNKGYIGTGSDGRNLKNDFWEFDPSKNTWTQKANVGGVSREWASGFSIGSLGYIGNGTRGFFPYENDFWEYNPTNNTWTQRSNVGSSGRAQAFAFSIGSKGYIGSGYGIGNFYNYSKDFLSFDQSNNTWTDISTINVNVLAEAVSFSIGNKGYLGTGYDGLSYKADFWQYDPASNSWTQKANLPGGARKGAVGFAIGNNGYVGTGNNGGSDLNDFWQYNPTSNTWTQRTAFPGLARSGAVGFVLGGKGYIGTGYRVSGTAYCKDFWAYDTLTQTWTSQADLPGLARSEAVAFSIANKAYVGTGYTGFALDDFWEFNPSTNVWVAQSNFAKSQRYKAVAFSIGNKGYLSAGYSSTFNGSSETFFNDLWEFDASGKRWTLLSGNHLTRYEATAFTIGNSAYVGTGLTGITGTSTTLYKSDLWEFTPLVPNVNIATNQTALNGPDSCTNATLIFTATPHDNAVSPSYQWYKNNSLVATGSSYTYTPIVYGDSVKCLMNSTAACSINASIWSNIIAIDNQANSATFINTWKEKSSLGFNQVNGPKARYGAVGFSIGGYGYLGTGVIGGDPEGSIYAATNYLDDFWQYDPASNSWTQKANVPGGKRGYAVAFVVGQKGYVGTGTDGTFYKNDFWEYDPAGNQWTSKSALPASPRYGAFSFSMDGYGYIGTGYGSVNGITNDFWQYNPTTNTWQQKANYGGGNQAFSVSFSIGSKGYVGIGVNSFGEFYEYDPSLNLWTQKASFIQSDIKDATGFSVAGKGYVCFGTSTSTTWDGIQSVYASPNTYRYDPSSNAWSLVADIATNSDLRRSRAAGFVIGDKVYVGTGLVYEQDPYTFRQRFEVMNDFWEFNPSATTSATMFVQRARFGGIARSGASSFAIQDKGYIVGGRKSLFYYNTGYKDVWQFDPANNSWSQKANFPGTTTANGIAFTVGKKGYYGLGGSNTDFWEYDPATNSWVKKANFPGTGRFGAVSFAIGSKGYVGTGLSNLQDFWEYNPSTNQWTQRANFGGVGRSYAVGFSINGKGYIGTGNSSTGYRNDFWEYDTTANNWTQRANFGGTARRYAVGFAVGGMGYIGTGEDISKQNQDFWAYRPETNTWVSMQNMSSELRTYATAFVVGDKAYVGTGSNSYGDLSDIWEFDPNSIRLKLKSVDSVYCIGSTVQLASTVGCIAAKSGNVFTAQLSDSSGSFQNPIALGTMTGTGSVNISASIPANVPSGSGYRIRMVASNPMVVSADNGFNILIKNANGSKTTVAVCGSYAWRGDTLNQSGMYFKQNPAACNATDTLQLTIYSSFKDTTTVSVCSNQFPYNWRGQSFSAFGIHVVSFVSQQNCDSSYYLNLIPGPQCQLTLTISGLLEGFTDNSGMMTPTLFNLGMSSDSAAVDSIEVCLWSPGNLSASTPAYNLKSIMKRNGSVILNALPNGIIGQSYYLSIRHRNSIEVWSASPVLFNGNLSYDFKTSMNAAYGDGVNSPLRNLGAGRHAFYSGDVNQDGTIDIFDAQQSENEALGFQFGYNPGDVNGDMSSDIFDMQLIENNSNLFIFMARPY